MRFRESISVLCMHCAWRSPNTAFLKCSTDAEAHVRETGHTVFLQQCETMAYLPEGPDLDGETRDEEAVP